MAYKILSVDDSRTIRMIVKKAFSAFECELHEAENGSEGLALASKIVPDLIVLDITMPVMTGVEMLNRMKEDDKLKDVPVIMLTAESGKDNVMSIVKLGVSDYIVKPFKGEQLIDRVKNILTLKPRLDASARADGDKDTDIFTAAGNLVLLTLPEKVNRSISQKIETAAKEKAPKLTAAGAKKVIIDTSQVADLNMNGLQLVTLLATLFMRSKLLVRLVAAENQIDAFKGFKETSSLPTFTSLKEANASF